MNLFDMRTVIFSYVISNAICASVIASLWIHNRRRFAGLGFWLADFVLQFAAMVLVALRGIVPDFVSMTVSNALVIGGTMLLFAGLEQFVGKRSRQTHNVILLTVFVLVHGYFTIVRPSLDARNIILSLGLLAICSQCAWLLLHRVDAEMRPIAWSAGIAFSVYCVISLVRIFVDLALLSDEDLFHSNVFDTSVVMLYQMLFIALTFGLFLMVNRRLVGELEQDILERQRTEAALSLSEEKFSKAFQSSPDAILITRMSDGKLVDVNEGFCRITGYSLAEALSSSSISLGIWANPEDRETCITALQENQRIREQEYNFLTKSGEILHCLYSGEIIQLGGEAHVLSIVRDMTEREKAGEALRESERRYRSLFENMLGGYAYCRMLYKDGRPQDFIYLEVNSAFEKLTGLSIGRGQRITEVIPDIHESNPELLEIYSRVALMGKPEAFETHVESIGRWFSVSVYSPTPEHFVTVFENITERKRADDELRKLSRVVEQSQVSVVITDTSGLIEYVNPKFSEVTGYSFEEVRGKNPRILRSIGAAPEAYRNLWDTILAGREWHGEFQNQKKNGELFWESTVISPIMNEQGTITHFVAVKEDVTERKRMDEVLRYRTEVLAALHQVTLDLVNRHEMDDILKTLLERIGVLLDASDISFDLVENNDTLVTYAVTSDQPLKKGDTMRHGEGGWLSWQAIETGQPAILEDYSTWPQRRQLFDGYPIHAIMIIPIQHIKSVIGAINISRREANRPFNDTDTYVSQQLAQMVALVLDNAQLYTRLRSELVERDRMERVLHERQENFQAYFNMATVGMCIISPEKRWVEANGRLCQMLGYSTGELDNLTWSELTHADDLDGELTLFNQVLTNQRDSYQLDKRFIRKDGATVYATTYVSCNRNPDGVVRYFLASMVDITERKQAEESLVRLTAVEERRRLARDLHDSVNQSIHSLVLFSETLVSMIEKNNTARTRQIAGRLQESARQALKETRLMLYEIQPSGPERGVNFLQDLETRLATVERRAGVRARIIQEGSMDYCPQAWYENLFWITIEALNNALKHAQAHNIHVTIRCVPQHMELEVADDGIGFDPGKARIGGLGLQNMRERAGLLGGELTVESTLGKGSCVHFSAEIKE